MRNYPCVCINKWSGAGGGAISESTADVTYNFPAGVNYEVKDIVGVTIQKDNDPSYPKYTENVNAIVALTENNKLKSSQDIATVLLGSDYCIPTKEDFNELLTNTTQVIDLENGIVTFTSKAEGNTNSIKFVLAGFWNGPSQIYGASEKIVPNVVTSTTENYNFIIASASTYAGVVGGMPSANVISLNNTKASVISAAHGCSCGFQVRAVYKKYVSAEITA